MVLPNQLTILRIILTPVFVYFFLSDKQWFREISLGIYLIAALTDWYDGWLARKFNYITSWGKFWDPMADKILTAGAFLALVYMGILPLWMIIVILIRDFLITGFRGYADYIGSSFPTSRYAQWKTFIQMAFLYYLLIVVVLSKNSVLNGNYPEVFSVLLNENFIYYCSLSITLITVHSGYLYFKDNRKLIRNLFNI